MARESKLPLLGTRRNAHLNELVAQRLDFSLRLQNTTHKSASRVMATDSKLNHLKAKVPVLDSGDWAQNECWCPQEGRRNGRRTPDESKGKWGDDVTKDACNHDHLKKMPQMLNLSCKLSRAGEMLAVDAEYSIAHLALRPHVVM